ncbi:NERD domain-containing protein [Ilumatobacter sp.]|uniref:nuclease-related domain-containing DEAD/DEAH box helicase n=1 Tax=Ilumatobacter sp. TaxID=1967498 RepID=UPI0037524DDB
MAVLIPTVFGRRLTSDAERKLAGQFERELPNDVVLMHSVGLVRHHKKRWAEVDFVLVSDAGVFCIEVKGGRVARKDGVWSFTDRQGHVDTKHEGPFEQAGSAAGALQAWLDAENVRRDDGSRFQVGHAVMIPDCELNAGGPDIEPDVLYDRRNPTESMSMFVERIGIHWQNKQQYSPLLPGEVQRLRNAIRPDFEATMTRTLQITHVEDRLIRATEEQALVLNALVDNERLVVNGAAGTGKSMLAIGEANRLAASGRSVLLVCHARELADALRHSVAEGVKVATIGGLMNDIVNRADLRDRLPDATEDALFDIFLPELAVEALRTISAETAYDALVIDEGQDLLRGDAVQVLDAALRGGFQNGCWRLFLDPNQNIFGRISKQSLNLVATGSPARYRLNENCRNTQQVVQFATMISGASVHADSRISGPEAQLCSRWDEHWKQRTIDQVHTLMDEGLPCGDIVVLVADEAQRRLMIAAEPGLLVDVSIPNHVQVTTVAAFKGLESIGVVLAGLQSLDEPALRQAAYVGATRAKVELRVVLPRKAKHSFQQRVSEFAAKAAAIAGKQERESPEAQRPSR